MRKKHWRSNITRIMVVMALAFMLFGRVRENTEAGIAPCFIEEDAIEVL